LGGLAAPLVVVVRAPCRPVCGWTAIAIGTLWIVHHRHHYEDRDRHFVVFHAHDEDDKVIIFALSDAYFNLSAILGGTVILLGVDIGSCTKPDSKSRFKKQKKWPPQIGGLSSHRT
jgi:hypothetical protein